MRHAPGRTGSSPGWCRRHFGRTPRRTPSPHHHVSRETSRPSHGRCRRHFGRTPRRSTTSAPPWFTGNVAALSQEVPQTLWANPLTVHHVGAALVHGRRRGPLTGGAAVSLGEPLGGSLAAPPCFTGNVAPLSREAPKTLWANPSADPLAGATMFHGKRRGHVPCAWRARSRSLPHQRAIRPVELCGPLLSEPLNFRCRTRHSVRVVLAHERVIRTSDLLATRPRRHSEHLMRRTTCAWRHRAAS